MSRGLPLLIVAAYAVGALGDVYLSNPRGSNDRNCERNENRDNANLLFDSQVRARHRAGMSRMLCPWRACGGPPFVARTHDVGVRAQNNAKGGYACPRAVGGPNVVTARMYYYAGSKVPIEFTAQHGCGTNPKVRCDVILQVWQRTWLV